MSKLLQNKNAIIYGAAGGIGREVALAFAREGATVFLAGRTRETLDGVAAEIDADGGTAHVAVVTLSTTLLSTITYRPWSIRAARSTCAST